MTPKPAFDLLFRATLSSSVVLLAGLACGSDADVDGDDGVEEGASASLESAGVIQVRPREDDPSRATAAGISSDVDGAAEGSESTAPAELPGAPSAGTADSIEPVPPLAFEACTSNGGVYGDNCDTIYVAVKQASPPRCVQFNIDNCGSYARQGLGADVPVSWRLASGSIGANVNECEVGVFYPDRTNVVDASGTITWNQATRLPTELVMELTLVPSGPAEDAVSVEITTLAPLNPVACIEE